MAYWLVIGPPENMEAGLSIGVWGVPLSQEKTWARLASGDKIIFYATSPIKGIVGSAVVGAAGRDDKPIWPEELRQRKALWPLRFSLDQVKALPRQRWESHHLPLERKGVVMQQALQPIPQERAREIIGELQKAMA